MTRAEKVQFLRQEAARLRDYAKVLAEVDLSKARYGTDGAGLGSQELERVENAALQLIGLAQTIINAAAKLREDATT